MADLVQFQVLRGFRASPALKPTQSLLLASFCMTQGHSRLHRKADFEVFKLVGDIDTWTS